MAQQAVFRIKGRTAKRPLTTYRMVEEQLNKREGAPCPHILVREVVRRYGGKKDAIEKVRKALETCDGLPSKGWIFTALKTPEFASLFAADPEAVAKHFASFAGRLGKTKKGKIAMMNLFRALRDMNIAATPEVLKRFDGIISRHGGETASKIFVLLRNPAIAKAFRKDPDGTLKIVSPFVKSLGTGTVADYALDVFSDNKEAGRFLLEQPEACGAFFKYNVDICSEKMYTILFGTEEAPLRIFSAYKDKNHIFEIYRKSPDMVAEDIALLKKLAAAVAKTLKITLVPPPYSGPPHAFPSTRAWGKTTSLTHYIQPFPTKEFKSAVSLLDRMQLMGSFYECMQKGMTADEIKQIRRLLEMVFQFTQQSMHVTGSQEIILVLPQYELVAGMFRNKDFLAKFKKDPERATRLVMEFIKKVGARGMSEVLALLGDLRVTSQARKLEDFFAAVEPFTDKKTHLYGLFPLYYLRMAIEKDPEILGMLVRRKEEMLKRLLPSSPKDYAKWEVLLALVHSEKLREALRHPKKFDKIVADWDAYVPKLPPEARGEIERLRKSRAKIITSRRSSP